MKTSIRITALLSLIFLCVPVLFAGPHASAGEYPARGATWVESRGFAMDYVYSRHEKFNFNIYNYINRHAPHLGQHAEAISHFAGRAHISPRLLMAIIQLKSGIFSSKSKSSQRPFGDLSGKTGFIEQARDFTEQLTYARYFSEQIPAAYPSPQQALASLVTEQDIEQLGTVYRQMFPGIESARRVKQYTERPQRLDLGMQFPWAIGNRWSYGGTHPVPGHNALDFALWEDWGDPIPESVVASHDGEVKRHSSCSMEIVLDDEWSTDYYHMDHLLFQTGEQVLANMPIGKYADNEDQALCNGGFSTGPHLHWSLWQNGDPYALHGVVLSGWTIHPGESEYDDNCDRMWMERDGEINCPWRRLVNEGVPDIVEVMPAITAQPEDAFVKLGSSATFMVFASGGALTYQWQLNGQDIEGEIFATLTTPEVDSSYLVNTYRVIVTNSVGTVTSTEASVTIVPGPSLGLDKNVYANGDEMTVTFAAFTNSGQDWIGLYAEGENQPANFLDWSYVSGASGTHTFTLDLEDGEYFAVGFENDSYTEATPRIPFSVSSVVPVTTVTGGDHRARVLGFTNTSLKVRVPLSGHWSFDLYTLDGNKKQSLWQGSLEKQRNQNLSVNKTTSRLKGVHLLKIKGPGGSLSVLKMPVL